MLRSFAKRLENQVQKSGAGCLNYPLQSRLFSSQNFDLDGYDNFDFRVKTKAQKKEPVLVSEKLIGSEKKSNLSEFLNRLKSSNQLKFQEDENALNIKKFKQMIYEEKNDQERLTESEFKQEIDRKYDQLSLAFSGLRSVDDRVGEADRYEDLTTNDMLMYLEISGVVNYLFRGELMSRELILTSSLSGVQRYLLDSTTQRWLSVKDSHFIDEFLLRELMGKTKGYLPI